LSAATPLNILPRNVCVVIHQELYAAMDSIRINSFYVIRTTEPFSNLFEPRMIIISGLLTGFRLQASGEMDDRTEAFGTRQEQDSEWRVLTLIPTILFIDTFDSDSKTR
jgi:hypothetical protein